MITSVNKIYSQSGFAGCCQSTTLGDYAVCMCKYCIPVFVCEE